MASSSSPSHSSEEYLAESIGWRLESTAIAFIVIQTACIISRAFSRVLQKTHFMWQDVFANLSYIFNIVLCIMVIIGVEYAGAGRHVEAVTPNQLVIFFKLFYLVIPVLYCVCFTLPKLAILDIFLHIFIDRWTRNLCYITGLVIILSTIVNIPTTIWQCSPVSYLWEQFLNPQAHGRCANISAHFLYSSLPSVVTDVVMLALPLPTIWKLHASPRMKLGLLATFLTGGVGLITSILRFVGFTQSYADATWAAVGLTVWIVAETGTYLLAACFMTYKQLIRYVIFQSPLSGPFRKLASTFSSPKAPESHITHPFRGGGQSIHQSTNMKTNPTPGDDSDIDNLISGHKSSNEIFELAEQGRSSHSSSQEEIHKIYIERQLVVNSSTT